MLKTWSEDSWTPFKRSRRTVNWVGIGEADAGIGGWGAGEFGSVDPMGSTSMASLSGAVPGNLGFLGNMAYGLTHQSPQAFSMAFNNAIEMGLDPSSAASYASEMAMPAPNLAGIRGAQNVGINSLFSPFAMALGIPNLATMTNAVMGRFGTSLADVVGLPAAGVPVGMPGMSPGAGGPGEMYGSMGKNQAIRQLVQGLQGASPKKRLSNVMANMRLG